ncbi:unnamed protein product [Trifolium pratense]|uniref:Uncharacterized protein n=1 Tax=Trifolium pratense TaxID=57577 RepID=A0ACB0KAW8_TRIPR|nr:unnamed protein product [Trifolium pratense]
MESWKDLNVFLQSLVILSLSLFSIMKLHKCYFYGGIVADVFCVTCGPIGKELFEKEQEVLLSDQRINEFVKQARAVKIHAYIISHLKKKMPPMMGKAKPQQKLIDNLAGGIWKGS